MKMRFAVVMLVALAACAKDASGPESAPKIDISGRWAGSFGDGLLSGASLEVTVIHDTVYGGVSGAGYLRGDTFEAVFSADGVVADTLVSMLFQFSGETVVNLTGVVKGREITGKVNGSGYVDSPLRILKQ